MALRATSLLKRTATHKRQLDRHMMWYSELYHMYWWLLPFALLGAWWLNRQRKVILRFLLKLRQHFLLKFLTASTKRRGTCMRELVFRTLRKIVTLAGRRVVECFVLDILMFLSSSVLCLSVIVQFVPLFFTTGEGGSTSGIGTCPVCLDSAIEVVVFRPCGHCTCAACLAELSMNSGANRCVLCPTCRTEATDFQHLR